MPNLLPDSCAEPVYLRVKHETLYNYPAQGSLGYNLAWLNPLEGPEQLVLQHRLRIDPKPRFQVVRSDAFDNRMHYFEVHEPHQQLRVVSEATVKRTRLLRNEACRQPWETLCYREWHDHDERVQLNPYAYHTQVTPALEEVAAYTAVSFTPGRPLEEALFDYSARINKDFQYESGATQVDTPLREFWDKRKGVCQDYAHLAVSGLRSIGLVVAYVSGYVKTYPAEGEEMRQGADASHAWLAVFVPGYGWLHIDPTNHIWVENEHLTVALGRDYTDVPPLKGLCYGAGQQQPEVAVTLDSINYQESADGN